jgi:steroid delta-isomerase-like uncharacterized protein
MNADTNKDLAARALEAIERNEPDMLDDFVAEDIVDHGSSRPDAGLAGVKEAIPRFLQAFPDVRIEIEDALASGDRVAQRILLRGTHRGPFAGIPATGRTATWRGMHWWRFEDGRIVEHWSTADMMGLLRQIGVDPIG